MSPRSVGNQALPLTLLIFVLRIISWANFQLKGVTEPKKKIKNKKSFELTLRCLFFQVASWMKCSYDRVDIGDDM